MAVEKLNFGNNLNVSGQKMHPAQRDPDPRLKEAAQGMEAMFLDLLMREMRKTVPENEMSLENPATKIYRSMQDSELAQQAAKQGGVGLADQIIAYYQRNAYNLNRSQNSSTGGTDEGPRNKHE